MTEMFEHLFERKGPEDGDYCKDGFLYCGKCHTARERTVDIGGESITVTMLCKCREREQEEAERAEEAREHKRLVELRRSIALTDQNMHEWTFANDDRSNPKLSDGMKRYADGFDGYSATGKGLMLYGGVGTGKTYYAACIINQIVETHTARFVTTGDLATLPFDARREFVRDMTRADLVVLDDVGAERGTEYMQELVFSVVDARSRTGKPLIVTTNLDGKQIKAISELTQRRIFDRIIGCCHPIAITGQARRTEKAKSEYKKIQEELGI